MQDVEGAPVPPTVVIEQPRLFFGDVAQALFIKTIELRIVVDLLEVPLHHF
jgi:hypothetical protein